MKARTAKKIMRRIVYAEIGNHISSNVWIFPRKCSVKQIRVSYSQQQIKNATHRLDLSKGTLNETIEQILGKRRIHKLAKKQEQVSRPFGFAAMLMGLLLMPLFSGIGGFGAQANREDFAQNSYFY